MRDSPTPPRPPTTDDRRPTTVPAALRALIRLDFVTAVLLTVVAPLWLLLRALRERRRDLVSTLLGYWRGSSLLMIAVYLLIGERRAAFVCGVGARLLIPWTLRRVPAGADRPYLRWRRIVSGYCLLGAALNLPTLRCALTGRYTTLCRAYVEPAQEFGDLLHPKVSRDRLGRAGEWGLRAFAAGALLLGLRDLVRARQG